MAIKTILAACPQTAYVEPSLSYGIALGKALDAALVVHHLMPPVELAIPAVYPPASGAQIGDLIATLEASNKERAEEIEKAVSDFCSGQGISVSTPADLASPQIGFGVGFWTQKTAPYPEGYGLGARAADLGLVARHEECTAHEINELCEALLFQSGQPALVVPHGFAAKAPSHIVVAWDGGKEAARAISAAMPLLQQAEQVSVVVVGNLPSRFPRAEDVVFRLGRHGVNASMDRLEPSGAPVEQIIQSHVSAKSGDLLVMGAYSHTRLREFVLGGVTRFMLHEATVPLFLAH